MRSLLKITLLTSVLLFMIGAMEGCKSRGPYNPYLTMKKKPYKTQIDADKKLVQKGNKAYKRQLGDSRKKLFGRRKAPGA